MYECPNCAGNLKFDIARQKLYCAYCGTEEDPYLVEKEKDAEEDSLSGEEYRVTVFSCPQCGAKLLSEDDTAATFCSFCGASTILDSRISKEKRPARIIPFVRTKEDCREAYKRMLRRAPFAPKELKDESFIEKFRGIYMPYWVYSFEKKEEIVFPGKENYRRGDYLITDHYELRCDVEEEYRGLAYDASSTFSDSLSGAIAPFDMRQSKEFTPSFLSGFYADTGDVEEYAYRGVAEDIVVEDAAGILGRDPVCKKCSAEKEGAFRSALRPTKSSARLAMLPVWFLSYRRGDRVSYAVVNGQTGRAAADLPVDIRRYLAGSLLLAVPFFFLLNLFFTVTPGKVLGLAVLLAAVSIFISNGQMTRILAKESGEDDRGVSAVKGRPWSRKSRRKRERRQKGAAPVSIVKMVVYIVILCQFVAMAVSVIAVTGTEGGPVAMLIFGVAALLIGLVGYLVLGGRRREEGRPFGGGHFKEKWRTLLKPFGGILFALVILFLNPVSDWFYYIGALGCMGTVLWAIVDIIGQHNMLATRKLPQLGRRGGDEIG